MTDPHVPGRREANKARTRAALVSAVYDLIEAEGVDALTAERVADAAGISRRTFFNYFASIGAVVAAGAQEVLEGVRAALARRPAHESLADAAVPVLAEIFTVELLAEATRAWRAVETSPAARRYALEAHADGVIELAHAWARDRLGGPDPLRADVLTACLLGAFDAGRRDWLARHSGGVDDAALADFLTTVVRAIDVVRPILAAA